jgi:nicotinamide riboside transporter PnuC
MPPPNGSPGDDPDEIPTFISQRLLTMISIIAVVALILGSASTIFFVTDWGLDVAFLIGLVVAALLVLVWLRMPKNGPPA